MSARPTIHTQIATLEALRKHDAIGSIHRSKRIRDSEAGVLRLSLAAAIESLEWLRDNRAACIAFIQSQKGDGP